VSFHPLELDNRALRGRPPVADLRDVLQCMEDNNLDGD